MTEMILYYLLVKNLFLFHFIKKNVNLIKTLIQSCFSYILLYEKKFGKITFTFSLFGEM